MELENNIQEKIKDINNELYNGCVDVINKYLKHKNFRVRAITAFCLIMKY